jgi:Tol biopolymer transport system component
MSKLLFLLKRKSSLYVILIIIAVGIIICGCAPRIDLPNTVTPTAKPIAMHTASPTLEPTLVEVEESATTTPSEAVITPLSLPPGQYIVYCSFDEITPEGMAVNSLFVIDTQGNYHGRLVYDACRSAISPDGKSIVVEKYLNLSRELGIINLESREEILLKDSIGCGEASWAPNGKLIVAACDNNIKVFAVDDDFVFMLDSCEDRGDGCGSPKWSPNGEAIVYDFLRTFNIGSGVYFTKTDCIEDQGKCEPQQLGSSLNLGTYSWSPDSRQIAAPHYPDSIVLLQFPGGSIEILKFIPGTTVKKLTWSPDGELLAVTTGSTSGPLSQVYLVNVASGTYSRIGDRPGHKSVMFWLNVD